jgi:hypothetical protein
MYICIGHAAWNYHHARLVCPNYGLPWRDAPRGGGAEQVVGYVRHFWPMSYVNKNFLLK